jgi:hypothetical protein
MINEFSVIQLGIPDDIISISILAKLSREHWNVVDNIILNKSIVFFPTRTLKKLQELVYMKDIRSETSTYTATNKNESQVGSAKDESVSAFKSESRKQRSNDNPCSTGCHNPKATHKEWKCWKLSDEQCIADRPKGETHMTKSAHEEPESDYVEVSAFLNFGPELNCPIILYSGASHHMVNDPKFFKKIKEVNIEINTGNKKQRVKAVAMGNVFIKDHNSSIITLSDVLLTPDLSRSLISFNRLFSKTSSITKEKNKFVINLGKASSLSGSIQNNLWELSAMFEMNQLSSCFLSTVSADWHARLGHPSPAYLKQLVPSATSTDCETCKMCKSAKLPFKGSFTATHNVLEAIHLDLLGPFQTRSVSGC